MTNHLYIAALILLSTASLEGYTATHSLTAGQYRLDIDTAEGISLKIGDVEIARNSTPVSISYFTPSDSSIVTAETSYSNISMSPDGSVQCLAELIMPDGTVFRAQDVYRTDTADIVSMSRKIYSGTSDTSTGNNGFRSAFRLDFTVASEDGWDYFIPSIIYRDNSGMRPGSIASRQNCGFMYVKESRTGIPMAMLRCRSNGTTLTLLHHNPLIDVAGYPGGGSHNDINNALKFGSIGYNYGDSRALVFNYPSIEGPDSYEPGIKRENGKAFSARFHNIGHDCEHSYTLAIIPGQYDDYNKAMTSTYIKAYEYECPEIRKIDMEEIYRQNIELLDAEWRSLGTGKIKAAGLPWSLDLPDGNNREGISYQMGFVGQQISVGYHLYRYGREHGNEPMRSRGKTIIDFWTSEAVNSTYFPTVWWDPAENEAGGRRREYPSFLRCMSDGMEGLYDACVYAADVEGRPNPQWEAVLDKVVSHIVEKQNPDGSFCRAYKVDGTPEEGGDRNTFGTSPMNTYVPVRLLSKMYRHTNDIKFKDAALRAARYVYDNFYHGMGKYVGGTPDNPNTVDKEASIYALYCFNAAHDLSGDPIYLEAAEHAAINAMSWNYCYDFAIPNRNDNDRKKNPFYNGGILGFSIIATGHSGADNFSAYMCHEMFRLYIKTRKPIYRLMASFLQNNTKLNTDYDGRMGYKYRAFMPEATNVADFAFRSVSVWLPWSSMANIDPLIKLKDEYGTMDIDLIDVDF